MSRTNRNKRRDAKKLLMNRDRRWVCHYCRRSVPESERVAEHVVPLCRGGSDRMDNIVMSCRECDHLKGPLTAEEFLAVRKDNTARKALVLAIHAQLKGDAA